MKLEAYASLVVALLGYANGLGQRWWYR